MNDDQPEKTDKSENLRDMTKPENASKVDPESPSSGNIADGIDASDPEALGKAITGEITPKARQDHSKPLNENPPRTQQGPGPGDADSDDDTLVKHGGVTGKD